MSTKFDGLFKVLGDQAKAIFAMDGHLNTTSYALGRKVTMFAQPMTAESANISPVARAGLLGLMMATSEAVVIGQIDESWMRMMEEGDPMPSRGELAAMADKDPNIRTALSVFAMHVGSGECAVSTSMFGVTDHGEPEWIDRIDPDPEGFVVETTRTAIFLGTHLSDDDSPDYEDLIGFFESCGWSLVVTPEEWME